MTLLEPQDFTQNFNVKRGSSGVGVGVVQGLLNFWGAHLDIDDDFGPLTEKAVKDFQAANGLAIDGVVGPNTSRALQDDASKSIGVAPLAPPKKLASGPPVAALVAGGLSLATAVGIVVAIVRRRRRS